MVDCRRPHKCNWSLSLRAVHDPSPGGWFHARHTVQRYEYPQLSRVHVLGSRLGVSLLQFAICKCCASNGNPFLPLFLHSCTMTILDMGSGDETPPSQPSLVWACANRRYCPGLFVVSPEIAAGSLCTVKLIWGNNAVGAVIGWILPLRVSANARGLKGSSTLYSSIRLTFDP